MTIFSPNQQKFSVNIRQLLWMGALVSLALLGIQIYSQNVAMRHQINVLEERFQTMRVTNAEYKNQLYHVLDSRNMQKAAEQLSLVKENKIKYLESNPTVALQ